jgi:hypothetical protein
MGQRVLSRSDSPGAEPDLPSLLQVGGRQTSVLCDSGEDARAQFLIVMEGKNEVWTIGPRECAV